MHLTFITIFFLNNLIPTYLERHSSKKIPSHGRNENVTSCCLGYVHTPGGGEGGYSLLRALWGRAASQGMFFGIFVLNRVSILSFFVLIRVRV